MITFYLNDYFKVNFQLGARKVKNINFDELEKDAKQQEKIKIAKEEKLIFSSNI